MLFFHPHLANRKGWKNIKKRKGTEKWFFSSSGKPVESSFLWSQWLVVVSFHFVVVFGTEGFGMGLGTPSLLPKGSPSAPVTILWLPRASLNCGSCKESIAWTWGSHGWPPDHSLHCRRCWLLPHCCGGGSMSVWLHWWIAVGSNKNPSSAWIHYGICSRTRLRQPAWLVQVLRSGCRTLPPHCWGSERLSCPKKRRRERKGRGKNKVSQESKDHPSSSIFTHIHSTPHPL